MLTPLRTHAFALLAEGHHAPPAPSPLSLPRPPSLPGRLEGAAASGGRTTKACIQNRSGRSVSKALLHKLPPRIARGRQSHSARRRHSVVEGFVEGCWINGLCKAIDNAPSRLFQLLPLQSPIKA